MAIVLLTKENFEAEVTTSDKPVVIDFFADWCSPCRMMGPVFEELSEEMTSIKFCKINTEKQPELAKEFGIQGIPSLSFVVGKEEKDRLVGFIPKPTLKQKLEELMEKYK